MPTYTDKTESRQACWPSRLQWGVLAAIALSLGAPGCVVRAEEEPAVVYGYPAVRVVTVPQDVYLYPRAEYQGSYAYYVNDAWYYETPRGWVVFQRAPRELDARRVYTVRGRERRPAHVHTVPRVQEERRVPAYTRPPATRERVRRPDRD